MLKSFRAILVSIALTGFVCNASAITFDPGNTQMPGEVYDDNGKGRVVSSVNGYASAPHVYSSNDNGTSWVELNRPPSSGGFPGHHVPTSIELRTDGIIIVRVNVGIMEASSPWNPAPVMHWYGNWIYTTDMGATWSAWAAPVPPLPGPSAAQDWQLYN